MGKRRNRRRRNRKTAPDSARTVADFWGSVDKLPEAEEVNSSIDAYAVVRSLGRPPFSGHEAVSEHYLRAVCQNAVKLAEALAMAAGINGDASSGEGERGSEESTSTVG